MGSNISSSSYTLLGGPGYSFSACCVHYSCRNVYLAPTISRSPNIDTQNPHSADTWTLREQPRCLERPEATAFGFIMIESPLLFSVFVSYIQYPQ